MNDAIIAELEKRGQRRSRGIKRLISTHYRRLGFLYCVALIFITSGFWFNYLKKISKYFSKVGCLFNTTSPMFSSIAIKLGVLILLYIVMFLAIKHVSFWLVDNILDADWSVLDTARLRHWNGNARVLVRSDQNGHYGDGFASSLADAWILSLSLCSVHCHDAGLALDIL